MADLSQVLREEGLQGGMTEEQQLLVPGAHWHEKTHATLKPQDTETTVVAVMTPHCHGFPATSAVFEFVVPPFG